MDTIKIEVHIEQCKEKLSELNYSIRDLTGRKDCIERYLQGIDFVLKELNLKSKEVANPLEEIELT